MCPPLAGAHLFAAARINAYERPAGDQTLPRLWAGPSKFYHNSILVRITHALPLPPTHRALRELPHASFHSLRLVNERSEFFRGLPEKSEYERPIPAGPMPTLLRGLYLRDYGSDFHAVFTEG